MEDQDLRTNHMCYIYLGNSTGKISCVGNNFELPYITSKLPGPYLGFESNFRIFLCSIFDVSKNILV